jgi:uncharacterized repeat protein (TIGR03803 family)
LSDNTLYGETLNGGEFGHGTIFTINTNATGVSGITILHNFTLGDGFPYLTNSDGAHPNGSLVLSGHTLYGTASDGGPGGWGTVFAVNTDGTGFKTLHSFPGLPFGPEGAYPKAGVVLSGNTLYGHAFYGGISDDADTSTFNGKGTIFSVNRDGSGFAVLHAFSPYGAAPSHTNSDGAAPAGSLIVSENTLYGSTTRGGSEGYGNIFKVDTDGTDFTVLHSFTPAEGNPFGSPLTKNGNILYGTLVGASQGAGTVFSITLPELKLSIAVSAPNVILSWPTNFPDSTLQFATDLAPPVWNVNLSPSVVVNGQYTMTNPISAKPMFYRLRE